MTLKQQSVYSKGSQLRSRNPWNEEAPQQGVLLRNVPRASDFEHCPAFRCRCLDNNLRFQEGRVEQLKCKIRATSGVACCHQEMYDKLRVDVGGPTAGGENIAKRTDDSIEPFCFHSMPSNVYKELLEVDLRPQAILDWTAGDGQLAWVAVQSQLSYVGACFSIKHKEELLERLTSQTLKLMQTEGSGSLYRPHLAELLSGTAVAAAPAAGNGGRGGGRGRGRGRGAPAPTPAAAAGGTTGAAGSADSDQAALMRRIQDLRNNSSQGNEAESAEGTE